MAQGPDRLEIHIHVVNQPPSRAGPSLGTLILVIVFWPALLFGWLIWFTITCLLTLAGILVLAGAGLIVAAGWLIRLAAPDAGEVCMALGRGIFTGTVHTVDRMNGHRLPSSRKPRV